MNMFNKRQIFITILIQIMLLAPLFCDAEPIMVKVFDQAQSLNFGLFSPDNSKIATTGYNNNNEQYIYLLDIKTNKLHTFGGHIKFGNGVHTIAFSPNNKLILSGGYSFATILWDANTGETIHEFSINDELLPYAVDAVCFTKDNNYAVIAAKGTINIYDINNFKLVSKFQKRDVLGIESFNTSDKFVVRAVSGVSVVDLFGKILFEIDAYPGYLTPDNRFMYFLQSNQNRMIGIAKYDASNGNLLSISDPFEPVKGISGQDYAFTSTGDAFLLKKTNRIMKWNQHKKVVDVVNDKGNPVKLQSFSNDDQYVSAIDGNVLYIYDTNEFLSSVESYNSY